MIRCVDSQLPEQTTHSDRQQKRTLQAWEFGQRLCCLLGGAPNTQTCFVTVSLWSWVLGVESLVSQLVSGALFALYV